MRVLISGSSSFWLSREAVLLARKLGAQWASSERLPVKGEPECWMNDLDREEGYSIPAEVPRHDAILLEVFDRLGPDGTGGPMNTIDEVRVPDDVTYFIRSYCAEWVAEQHRVWDAHHPNGRLDEDHPVFTKDSVYQTEP